MTIPRVYRAFALTLCLLVTPAGGGTALQTAKVERLGIYEHSLAARESYTNPYTAVTAEAELIAPGGSRVLSLPLFWDGGPSWMLRFSPDVVGIWRWSVRSSDRGLDGQSGSFEVVDSQRRGSIRPMEGYPTHFERQDGTRFWFLGDTAWALFTDNPAEQHGRATAMGYVDQRAEQGFNVIHSMLLSEAGWGNSGGLPFEPIETETLNPGYWQEVDRRLEHVNSRGIVCGLVLAWGDKRKVEPFPWRRFPSAEARRRYARYIAARFSAFDVYFLVSGEWHGEIRTTAGATETSVRDGFNAIGEALQAADPHGRMIAIHPMSQLGSVREFNSSPWMSFGDYQQNYRDLHRRILQSLAYGKPVVNGEYGYFLRDQDEDGTPDKDNSTSLDVIRHASWDIAMAGGYFVTGFGTTYFGGNRDPGSFDPGAPKNRDWERQAGLVRRLFSSLEWWKLEPHDELVTALTPREGDRSFVGRVAPPTITYWCLAETGRQYVAYVRGLDEALNLAVPESASSLRVQLWNPRTGESSPLDAVPVRGRLRFLPPDEQDWVVVLR